MNQVAVVATSSLQSANHWGQSLADLALDVAEPLLDRAEPDGLFCASTSRAPGSMARGTSVVIADRLALPTTSRVYGFDDGDATGAAALHTAVAHIQAGLVKTALVVGVAKVSDLSEPDRYRTLDEALDRDAEVGTELTYLTHCGLLADLYLRRYGLNASALGHLVSHNLRNALSSGATQLKLAPSAAEVRKDVKVASPLTRSDFAPLLDGAVAILLSDTKVAWDLGDAPLEVLGISAARDTAVVWERGDPLCLSAVQTASSRALAQAHSSLAATRLLQIENACSLMEVLSLETLGVTRPGQTLSGYADGFGLIGGLPTINSCGGAIGRGHVLGAGGLAQVHDVMLAFTGGGCSRSAEALAESALCVSFSAFASTAFATVLGRMKK
jgi:acetyl-CoA acetyltransferase